ncbi:succinic semialdehyde dehydrogenase [Actinophytocola glycyrrhizae]|uniref:Succinic semialdehyde dehydrogenase n=1 Tax=Actinophytocola glycyrrhizae TaxID=2044873 RepID=A0ABV9S8Y2_9PSEU
MRKNVCVIGAGPSGLVATKELLAENHSVTCFEHSASPGGMFRAGVGSDEPGAYDSTKLTISNYMMTFSSFPPRDDERRYWSAAEYRQYLLDFIEKFDLGPSIRYGTDVLGVTKDESGEGYVVEVAPVDDPAARTVHRFDAVVVSTGTHRVPNYVDLPGQDDFTGEITHSAHYRNAERFRGKRVLCIGIGETAADVVSEIAQVADHCALSVRRYQPVIARYPRGREHTNDTFTSYLLNAMPLSVITPFQRLGTKLAKRFGKTVASRAVAAWNSKNDHYFNHFITKNEAFLHRITDGTLTVNASGIERLGKDYVVFKDGRRETVDTIMLNTGYVEDFSLVKDVDIDDVRKMYKHMIHPELGTGVVFIGWARPTAGGVPACSEMQSRYFALLCSGKRTLPEPARLEELIEQEAAFENEVFFGNPDLRTLVHYNRFMIGMAKLIGCSPWRPEILASPALAYRLWSGSQVPAAYRLFGPHSDHRNARKTILSLPSGFSVAQTALLTAAVGGARLLTAAGLRKPDPAYDSKPRASRRLGRTANVTRSISASPLLSRTLTQHLAGQLTGTGPVVTATAPWTGDPLVDVRTSTSEDVAAAYARARGAQARWAAVPVSERAKVFRRYHDLVLGNQQLLDVVQAQTGKARYNAVEESLDVAGMSLYYARHARRFLEPRRRKGGLPIATRPTELRHPKGVVAIIAPFNYPLADGHTDVIPALMAGNAVVFKPDTQVALTSLLSRELMIKAGLPASLWQIVVGEPDEIGQALIDGADHVCFTGSTASGSKVAEAAGSKLISATLELGGKNPMIVLADADLDKAVKGAARAGFTSSGQNCLSNERIYVHESVYATFLARMVEHTRTLTLGSGLDFGYDIGSLSSQRQFDKTVRHVEDAVAKGAKVEAGGKARPDLGPYFYEPTILTGVTPAMTVYTEETFGPVVSIYSFADEDQAVALANATEYGLGASIWSRDVAHARDIATRVKAGQININESFASVHISNDAPQGGMKSSGLGRRHGEYGLLSFCELQTVASQHGISFDLKPGVTREQAARQNTMVYKIMKALRLK